jgi:hypothetical protein
MRGREAMRRGIAPIARMTKDKKLKMSALFN